MSSLQILSPNPVARPPWTKMGKTLESACRKAIFDFNLIDASDKKIAIALSGGKDSLTLLFLLHAMQGRGLPPFEIHALTVSGEFSCGPAITEQYLKKVCHELGVPLHILRAEGAPKECYGCSRTRRFLLFQKARELGISKIAFGHHKDDSIQTLLLNLFHKGEFAANLAKMPMEHFGITIIRPLIYIQEAQIIAFAKLYGFQRITCQCPIGANSKRARVKKMIESIETEFPNLRNNLSIASLLYGSQKALRKP